MRNSRQRNLVEDILKNCRDHPTADVIYMRAREVEPNISLGTVYRNLASLSKDNKILTLETIDKKIHYDRDISPHQHFICSGCGKIIDIFSEPKLPDEVGAFRIETAKCVFYGLCEDCIQKN